MSDATGASAGCSTLEPGSWVMGGSISDHRRTIDISLYLSTLTYVRRAGANKIGRGCAGSRSLRQKRARRGAPNRAIGGELEGRSKVSAVAPCSCVNPPFGGPREHGRLFRLDFLRSVS